MLVVAWAIAVLTIDRVSFVLVAPRAKTGFDVTLALISLFVALVLVLFPDEPVRERLRWVATGFLVLGLGGLAFGYVLPLVNDAIDLNTLLYTSLITRTIGGLLMTNGLWPASPPRCGRRAVAASLAAFAAFSAAVLIAGDRLPLLARVASLETAERQTVLPGLTAWHWALSLLPLVAALAASAGAARYLSGLTLGIWLASAMVLMAGSQIHTAFWPSAYSPLFTTASALRVWFTVVVAVGAVLELRRVAAERAGLLAAERATSARLTELAHLRTNFTTMVVHELATPLAAVRRSAELAAADPLSPSQQRALATIANEVAVLDTLVADVQAAATVERDDFTVHPFPVDLALLLADAVAYAGTLPGDHAIACSLNVHERVLADPERIAQVLHNLLNNAAKYSPPATPIAIRTIRNERRVRIEVADRGPGIHPGDLTRIFEQFGRGRDAQGRKVPGLGLGLYLSRRIVRDHGGQLRVESIPGHGATFWFELEVVA